LRSLEEASPQVGKAAAGWSQIHGVIFAAALFVATAGVIITAYHAWAYFRVMPYATDYSPEVIQIEAEHIDKLTPEEALADWTKLVEDGLGPKDPFVWTTAQATAKTLGWWIRLGGGLIAGGVLTALATLFIGRRSG